MNNFVDLERDFTMKQSKEPIMEQLNRLSSSELDEKNYFLWS